MHVFLLSHTHEFDDGHEDVKLIGLYSSRSAADAVQKLLAQQPGFRTAPEGWAVDEHVVDPPRPDWEEGYATYLTILVPATVNGLEKLRPVQAWYEGGDRYTIADGHKPDPGEVWRFAEGETVLCREHVLSDGTTALAAYKRAVV